MADQEKSSSLPSFRTFFFRGLGILLPSVLTIFFLVAGYQFLSEKIAEPINSGLRYAVVSLYEWPEIEEEDYIYEYNKMSRSQQVKWKNQEERNRDKVISEHNDEFQKQLDAAKNKFIESYEKEQTKNRTHLGQSDHLSNKEESPAKIGEIKRDNLAGHKLAMKAEHQKQPNVVKNKLEKLSEKEKKDEKNAKKTEKSSKISEKQAKQKQEKENRLKKEKLLQDKNLIGLLESHMRTFKKGLRITLAAKYYTLPEIESDRKKWVRINGKTEARANAFKRIWNQYTFLGWAYLDTIGLLIAVILVYLAGRLLGSFLGKRLYNAAENMLTGIPGFKQIYPHVKQITDFMFGADGKDKIKFSKVVAVEYPRKGMWSIGLVTGETLITIQQHAQQHCVTVFVPSSPTPFTGYVVTVPKSDTIDLPISIDEALRFTVSGGVIIPDHQLTDLATEQQKKEINSKT